MTNHDRARKLDRIFEGYGDYVDPIEVQLNEVELLSRLNTFNEIMEEVRFRAQIARDHNNAEAAEMFEDLSASLRDWAIHP